MGKVELDNTYIAKVYIAGIEENESIKVLYLTSEKNSLLKKAKIIEKIQITDEEFEIIKTNKLKEFNMLYGFTKSSEQNIALYNPKSGSLFKYLLPENYFSK